MLEQHQAHHVVNAIYYVSVFCYFIIERRRKAKKQSLLYNLDIFKVYISRKYL